MFRTFVAITSAAFVLASGASAFGAEPKQVAKITYDDHVLPLLRDKCLSCHSPEKKKGSPAAALQKSQYYLKSMEARIT